MFAWVLASDGTSLPVLTPLLPVLAHRAAEAMPQMRAAGASRKHPLQLHSRGGGGRSADAATAGC